MPLAMFSKLVVYEVMKGMYVDVIKGKISRNDEKAEEFKYSKIKKQGNTVCVILNYSPCIL